MSMIITCQKCKKKYRYSSDDIENTGTIWHPIWTVKCYNCGSLLKFDQGEIELFHKSQISRTKDGIEIKKFIKPNGHERAEKGDIREYWVQEYFKENYKKLGFSKIEGPYETGPDFKGLYKGKKVIVEVERSCKSFIEHKHHKNTRFKDVNVLIVLSTYETPENIKNKLPKTIVRINIDDFVEWWRPRAKAYAKRKRIQSIINLLASEFNKRFVKYCDDKDRDMSTCPDCDLCPYFGDVKPQNANIIFQEMALKFVAIYDYPITSEDFSLSAIKPSEIDKFYNKYIFEYL